MDPQQKPQSYPNLDFIKRLVAGDKPDAKDYRFRLPAPIAKTLGMEITAIALGTATLGMTTDPEAHGNPMGTVHGGVLADLADLAIGTAHSTTLQDGESFTSVDLTMKFFRPVWATRLQAIARPVNAGRTLSYYVCDVTDANGKVVCTANSTVMTLRESKAAGR